MSEYVPRTIEYTEGEPIDIDGTVVGILTPASRSSRRATLLVEEQADEGDDQEVPEELNFEEEQALEDASYRELQETAQALGIKANQSTEDLIEAIRNE